MKVNSEDILRRVEQALAEDGGARIIHDLLEQLAQEMETLSREVHNLRGELISALSKNLDVEVPESLIAADGPETLTERLKQVGLLNSISGRLPEEAIEIWGRLAPPIFALKRKRAATDALINDIVERLYKIPRIPE